MRGATFGGTARTIIGRRLEEELGGVHHLEQNAQIRGPTEYPQLREAPRKERGVYREGDVKDWRRQVLNPGGGLQRQKKEDAG